MKRNTIDANSVMFSDIIRTPARSMNWRHIGKHLELRMNAGLFTLSFSAQKEPDAPTEIIGGGTQIEITEPPANLLDESKEGDLVLLNIRENMNQGKSFTWLYYASNYLSGHLGIDYIGKMDTDTLISMKSYFQFHEKFLFPTPMNANTLVGHFLDKKIIWRVNKLEREETYFRTRWESIHVSIVLVKFILCQWISQIPLPPRLGFIPIFVVCTQRWSKIMTFQQWLSCPPKIKIIRWI